MRKRRKSSPPRFEAVFLERKMVTLDEKKRAGLHWNAWIDGRGVFVDPHPAREPKPAIMKRREKTVFFNYLLNSRPLFSRHLPCEFPAFLIPRMSAHVGAHRICDFVPQLAVEPNEPFQVSHPIPFSSTPTKTLHTSIRQRSIRSSAATRFPSERVGSPQR